METKSGLEKYFFLPSPLPVLFFRYSRALLRTLLSRGSMFWEYPDNISTPHNKNFFLDENFQVAYRFASDFAGRDYRIPWRVHQAIWAARTTQHLDGAIVELGTGRGFIMSAVLRSAEIVGNDSRKVYLYDTFVPPSSADDPKARFASFYADNPEQMRGKFTRFPRASLVVGDVFKTVADWGSGGISLLHVDLNDASAETFCLRALWPNLLPGAIVLLDDYANKGLETQYEAVNAVMEEFGHPVLTTPSGQGIVVRRQTAF